MSNSLVIASGSFYMVSGSLPRISGSIHANELTGSAVKTTFQLDPNDPTSFLITGSEESSFYMSSSGKMGFGTDDPLVAFDIRADEFQIQKQSKRQGIRVNDEGNIESFNGETDAAATGSEFILSYSRGGASKLNSTFLQSLGFGADEISGAGGAVAFFNSRKRRDQDKILFLLERTEGLIDKASVGDVLGSIRWVASSGSISKLNSRTAGEAATIQAVVNASNAFGTSADLIFKIADKSALEGASSDLGAAGAPKTALLLDGDFDHEMTGSLTITNNLSVKGNVSASGTVTAASAVLTTANINTGNITANITVGAEQTLELREAGTINFANNSISGNAINGGTIDATTITQLTSTNITASGNISSSGNITAPSYTGQLMALDRLNYYITINSSDYFLGRAVGIEGGDFDIIPSSPFSINDEHVFAANILPVSMSTVGLRSGVRVSGGGTCQIWITTGSRSDWSTADTVPLGFGASGSVTLGNGQDFAALDIPEFSINDDCDVVYVFVRSEDGDSPTVRVTGQLYGRTR